MWMGLLSALLQAGTAGGWTWEGRVLDAASGAPLAAVRCELWTEDMYDRPRLVADCSTAADGTYALNDSGRQGAKLVLRRAGYRSTEKGTPEDELKLFPALLPHGWRVVDVEGRPIEGALVRTRQSCRHAIPAVEVTSDSHGLVLIPDLPPLADGGDLEVLAAGHGALGKLWLQDAWCFRDLVLPRRRGLTLRCLDQEGRPIAGGSLRYEGDQGGYPLFPDAQGWVRIDSLFDDRDGVVFWRRGQDSGPTRELRELPGAGAWTVRFDDPAPGTCDARIAIAAEGPGELREARVRLIHEAGWIFRGAGEHELPAGVLQLVVGGPFTGVCERITRVELRPGESQRHEAHIEPEPRLRLRVAADTLFVHVQAGDDSITLAPPREPGAELETPVPPDRAVTVFAQGTRARQRATLPPWSGTITLDLQGAGTRMDPEEPEAPAVELRFRVGSLRGEPLVVEARMRAPGASFEDLDPAAEDVLFRLPHDTRWEASFAAEGHATLYREGLARKSSSVAEEILLP
jgi:hypothetical protein